VKGAAEIIIHSLRTTVEHWPNKVVLVLDIKKAYPFLERATITKRLLKVPDIGNYPRLFDALNKSGCVWLHTLVRVRRHVEVYDTREQR
jgi:hypothetical protein